MLDLLNHLLNVFDSFDLLRCLVPTAVVMQTRPFYMSQWNFNKYVKQLNIANIMVEGKGGSPFPLAQVLGPGRTAASSTSGGASRTTTPRCCCYCYIRQVYAWHGPLPYDSPASDCRVSQHRLLHVMVCDKCQISFSRWPSSGYM